MSNRRTLFADVILPVPIHRAFTYRIPFEMNDLVGIGLRVIVPFGRNKLHTAIVVNIHENVPNNYQSKYIEAVLDHSPIVTNKQLMFWKWVAQYYMSAIGDVMNAALPANFKLGSETNIILHPEFEAGIDGLDKRGQEIVEYLEAKVSCDLKELAEFLNITTIQPIVKTLIEKRILISKEEIKQRYAAKTSICYQLKEQFQSENNLNIILEELKSNSRLIKQFDALIQIVKIAEKENGYFPIQKKILTDSGISLSALASLEKKGVLSIERFQIDRIKLNQGKNLAFKKLTKAQSGALKQLENEILEHKVTLLHGVTGSGKTELYVQLIQDQLDQGKQVLFLLPEIALTTQLIQRLSDYFGESIGVYHSKFNQNERVEIWNKVLQDDPHEFRIVLGARSAVFLPFQSLGLIIVDEEHESSFKQYDPAPRYNGRDAAIVLGRMHNAKVLLGTATPSLESYTNAKQGKYGLVSLRERYKGLRMPEVLYADLKRERKLKNMNSHFSHFLLEEMDGVLKKGEQVILFQNRRGYNPLWSCEICNWTPKCNHCDVSLTYHKSANLLKCHYCGYSTNPVGSCPSCGSNRLKMIGFGTEKIEDELGLIFKDQIVKRLDLDTTRSKNAYEKILNDFDKGLIDVLIGTQMITKGLDFDNVYLVGILDADMLLNRPDFRAYERSYQLMSQVAGRAGRQGKQGKVIVQTGNPDHWVLQLVGKHDYEQFYENEIIERANYHYPPFYKLISFTLKHENIHILDTSAQYLVELLKNVFKERVIGPEYPLVQRIRNKFLKTVKLKVEKNAPDVKVKEKIKEIIDNFYANASNKKVQIVIDVDPL